MRRLLILMFLLFCGIGITLGYFYWPKLQRKLNESYRPGKEEEAKDLKEAKELLDQSKPEEALKLIHKYENFVSIQNPQGKEWINLLIKASDQLHNTQQLVILYEYFPSEFDNHEEASLQVAHAYIATGRLKDFEELREKWRNKETKKALWFIVDADRLIVEGKKKEAEDFLKTQSFTGNEDTNRLLRLAWIAVEQNPKGAWDYLSEAHEKDPTNPIIRIYRARLLEAAGKTPLALSEYIAALQSAPNDLGMRDQLAEFFRRYHQFPQAAQIWSESLKLPDTDSFWVKGWFWSKVITPIKFDWQANIPTSGSLKPLIDYLALLKPEQFWNDSTFEKVPNGNALLRSQQVTFWLRLIEKLKQGKDKEAIEILNYNVFKKVSWNTDLENTLQRVLAYRQTGSLKIEDPSASLAANQKGAEATFAPENFVNPRPQFFNELEMLANAMPTDGNPPVIPDEIKQLLKSDEVITATFLAAGWWEVALQLNKMSVIPDNFPDWIAYGLTQALRLNRTNEEALQFATKQKQTPLISLLVSELLIAMGSPDAALDKLKPLSQEDSEVGLRAAWMMSLIYGEKKDFTKAKEMVNLHPKLAQSVVGRETLARIALLEGNNDLADSIYTSMEKESAEAKSYLARKAFADKNWAKARELTEQLLIQFPTNILVRQNLQKIMEEEQKAKQGFSNPSNPQPTQTQNNTPTNAPQSIKQN